MKGWLSRFVDRLSDFLARNKGLLPLLAILLIFVNFVLRQLAPNWFSNSDFFLHLGIILGILGLMIARAL
jgi:TRAP-type mannitol/chloroaromatic compound transport system permease small subunit